jgi:hypothetical protein
MLGRASWRRNRIFNQSGQSQAVRAGRCARPRGPLLQRAILHDAVASPLQPRG